MRSHRRRLLDRSRRGLISDDAAEHHQRRQWLHRSLIIDHRIVILVRAQKLFRAEPTGKNPITIALLLPFNP